MRVLIADKFEQSGRSGLEAAGCTVLYFPDVKDERLVEAIRREQPDVLIVRGTKVTEPMLDAGPIKLVVRAGAGYNTIDVAAASRRGIYVSNCPGQNSVAVAELAFGLILALDRRIPDNVAQLREGQWNKGEFSKARSLRAGLDVFQDEPAGATGEFRPEIAALPGFYGTHHIGASTDQAQEAIAAETVRIIRVFKETGVVPNVVNLASTTPATHKL